MCSSDGPGSTQLSLAAVTPRRRNSGVTFPPESAGLVSDLGSGFMEDLSVSGPCFTCLAQIDPTESKVPRFQENNKRKVVLRCSLWMFGVTGTPSVPHRSSARSLESGWRRLLALVLSPLWQRRDPDSAIGHESHASRADTSHRERARWEEMISLRIPSRCQRAIKSRLCAACPSARLLNVKRAPAEAPPGLLSSLSPPSPRPKSPIYSEGI